MTDRKVPDLGSIAGRRVLVLGFGRSGLSVASALSRLGAEPVITDIRSAGELDPEGVLSGRLRSEAPGARTVLGAHPEELLEDAHALVLSPGVPATIPFVRRARELEIPVIGEVEFAWLLMLALRSEAGLSPLPFYAVTGTNGKSTTVTLLNEMFLQAGIKTVFGGNIGLPLTGEIMLKGLEAEAAVVELSSFQLETLHTFRAHGGAILNITADHLDRYPSLWEYRDAKARIFDRQQSGDFVVLNHDDPVVLTTLTNTPQGRVRFFSRKEQRVEGVFLSDGEILADMPEYSGRIAEAGEIKLEGVHNLENAMAAACMALMAEVPVEAVRRALGEFPGLEHRLEFVREKDGVRYINDSKGTNVGAVMRSLESFPGPVILIAGGRDKEGEFESLRPIVAGRVSAAVLIGEAREKIRRAIGDLVVCQEAGDMREAVRSASALAAAGSVVLLSPACASFDMFRDYEERGRVFKEEVAAL